MNISIIGRQFGITRAIYGHVTEQLKSLVSATPLKVTSATVVFGREKNRFSTTLVLNCKYHTLKAEVESFDLYRSFDAAVGKVEHQLYVLTDRVRDHRGVALRELEGGYAETAMAGEE